MDRTNLQKITDLRHDLHKHPELSANEAGTIARIRRFLEEKTSLCVEEREGWLFAVKEGADPKAGSIAFRAELDALPIDEQGIGLPYESVHPGCAHKCGHDGHCAALCGLALELDEGECAKTVYLIFQSAEEISEGGKKAAALIKEKAIGEVYAFHNISGFPEGCVVFRRGLTQPASEGLTIHFQGKTSHASQPEEGKNPSIVIAKTVLAIQTIIEKGYDKNTLCTIVGMNAGTGDFGISAGDGSLMLTLRAGEESALKVLENEILTFAKAQGAEAGISVTWQISDDFPETRNTPEGIERVLQTAQKLGIPTIEMADMWRPSEDFGYFLKECSGAMFYIGSGESWPALHTREYDFNDRLLETAVEMLRGLI